MMKVSNDEPSPGFNEASTLDQEIGTGPPAARLLTAQNVSAWWQLPLQRVYELARQGTIPHVRINRQLRFDELELTKWLRDGGTRTLP
jgi:hypothetical protein